MPDSLFLKYEFKKVMGRPLDLKNPVYYNDKLQWLKLHDHNPAYIKLVDKYEAKEVIGKLIGMEYIIPTLGVWKSVDEIDFGTLPEKFVLKCTHDSGGVVICRNKKDFNTEKAKDKLRSHLKKSYFWYGRDWQRFKPAAC